MFSSMQQTTVAVGRQRFPRWMRRFPSWDILAQATSEEVMKEWEGLGYYARARALHALAQTVMTHHGGHVPQDRSARLALPGVGPSTASALGAFIWGFQEPIWDANVNRVWQRWWGNRWPTPESPAQERSWRASMSKEAMPSSPQDVRQWTQAVMDLGATVCSPKSPSCSQCPWVSSCQAQHLGTPTVWPAPVKKPAIQVIWKNWAWLVNKQGQIAVLPPVTKGIWAGLWRLPELRIESPLLHPADDQPVQALHAQGSHKLTHRNITWSLTAHPSTISEHLIDADCSWVSPAEWEAHPWPKPLRSWWDGLSPAAQKQWLTPAA